MTLTWFGFVLQNNFGPTKEMMIAFLNTLSMKMSFNGIIYNYME